ncbi:LysR substrate-binding domain-containing protein [Roseateles sp. P5_E11]
MPWEFDVGGVTTFHALPVSLCSSDTETEMRAVVNGMGVGQIDSINATPALREGSLIAALVDQVSERMGLYLFYPHRTDMPVRVRRFVTFALDKLHGSDEFHLSSQTLRQLQASLQSRPGQTGMTS